MVLYQRRTIMDSKKKKKKKKRVITFILKFQGKLPPEYS